MWNYPRLSRGAFCDLQHVLSVRTASAVGCCPKVVPNLLITASEIYYPTLPSGCSTTAGGWRPYTRTHLTSWTCSRLAWLRPDLGEARSRNVRCQPQVWERSAGFGCLTLHGHIFPLTRTGTSDQQRTSEAARSASQARDWPPGQRRGLRGLLGGFHPQYIYVIYTYCIYRIF